MSCAWIPRWALQRLSDALLLLVVLLHILNAPFTKVEESFNLQAVHDMLYHGDDLQAYDHHQFPGVVPRTFLGAAALATLSAPAALTTQFLGYSKLVTLYAVRFTLGFVSWACMTRLAEAVHARLGPSVRRNFVLITAAQFHLPFYMSRPLPNTFALCLVSLAFAHALDGTETWLVPALLTGTAVALRCDMVLLTATISLYLLLSRRISVPRLVAVGAATGACTLAASVTLDSALWGRWLWPEGEVLWFNTVLNRLGRIREEAPYTSYPRSQEWGVMPFHWYWTSALPRTLLAALPLSVVGVAVERRVRGLFAAVVAFIFLYSFLGHKEIRFLLPALSVFNVAAAAGLDSLLKNRHKSRRRKVLAALAVLSLCASALLVLLFAWASRHNYPGATAMQQVHEMEGCNIWIARRHQDSKRVHVGTAAAMTGVSRFLEIQRKWVYHKADDLSQEDLLRLDMDFAIMEAPELPGYSLSRSIDGFSGLRGPPSIGSAFRDLQGWRLPLQLVMEPKLHIMRVTEAV